MLYLLTALLLIAAVTAVVLYFNVRMHRDDALWARNELWATRERLGAVYDALSDLPQSPGTEPATIILRHKHEALKTRNKVWEAQKVLREENPKDFETVRLVKQLEKILGQEPKAGANWGF